MSTLAEFPKGIPIPLEEIRSAIESVAIPGFTGVLQLDIGLRPEAAACVMVGVIRRQVHRPDQAPSTHQTLPDPTRRKPVERAIETLKAKLMIRCQTSAVELHYADGILQRIGTVE